LLIDKGPSSDEALTYMLKTLELAETKDDIQVVQMCFEYLGQIYTSKGEYELAVEHYKNAMTLAERTGDQPKVRSLKVGLGAAEGSLRMKSLFRM
jgi:tetratricopeptide (TPR) repeat protein